MESPFSIPVFLVLLYLLTSVTESRINLGSRLSPTIHPTSWLSSSGRFAFGFYEQSNGFAIGIWLVGTNPEKKTVVWTANRDDPPVTSNATLDFTKDGKLLLQTVLSEEKHIASVSEAASLASMLDSGNFVLYNNDSKIIWQSFNSPTDTILGGQNLWAGHHLVSSFSEKNHSTGRFDLIMQHDGKLVLYPLNSANRPADAYWAPDSYGYPELHLYLNQSTGDLLLRDNTGVKRFLSSIDKKFPNDTIFRATVDVDGNFRLYSHSFEGNGKPTMTNEWSALDNQCYVNSFCGFNSYCTFMDNTADCLCLKGFEFVDPNDKSRGCQSIFTRESCRNGKGNAKAYNITTLDKMTWGDYPYSYASMTEEDCSKSCLEECNCEAALYDVDYGKCGKQKLPLRYIRRDQSLSTKAFLKLGKTSIHGTHPIPMNPPVAIDSKKANVLILVVTLGFIICSFVAISVSGYFIYKERVYRYRRLLGNGNLGLREELTLRMFSYNELVKATDGFKEELGRGSFGAVYKGVLSRGSKLVAVKRLEKVVEEGEREFRAEMRAIGRTHHRNLVRTFTGVRGTRGYLAPEWQKNTPISVKADIYSFGVVLLEIICCRRNLEVFVSRTDEIVLSTWVYNCFVDRQLDKLVGGEEVDKNTLETMVKVGLWCIQDEPHLRPSMKNVILMLQGIMDVPVPPSPTPSSMTSS
ncbi:hypothetical protein HHK36_009287 [Tetracentron sinense]|uniref:Bulb-type lectin domain-containing protein n=1 Tax=Tetracentron sinense TaxID=13715 RepID=A0A835DKW1_TETSI|nr:hypothetical protein HHK36_009287 [Tetracentron sinense]